MKLTADEQEIFEGKRGNAARKSMEILVALGKIYGARRLIPVKSVQVAGVSYHNLGDAGLEYLSELARDGKVVVKTTLNPAGMDLKDWKKLGISDDFAAKQLMVIDAFKELGIETTATCTPYLVGNRPNLGDHIAWSESSAVCFANSVLGARTNREGGPSALAAAIVGKTPEYGLHLDENRLPVVTVDVRADVRSLDDYSALGHAIGTRIGNKIPLIRGASVRGATQDVLKIFCASIATYGGTALFHMEGVTPEKVSVPSGSEVVKITDDDIRVSKKALTDDCSKVDFVAIGCPHASREELVSISGMLRGKRVVVPTWISTARKTLDALDPATVRAIEDSGAVIAADTCMAVAPLKGRFTCMATNSAKACFYGHGSNGFLTKLLPTEECIRIALGGSGSGMTEDDSDE